MNTIQTKNTATVFARHKRGCEFPKAGDKDCVCPKYLLVYEAGRKKNRMVSAHTRSWTEAEKERTKTLDSWDPEKIELHQLRAKKEAGQTTLVDAVALYILDLITQHGDNGTVAMARSLFGHIDPKTMDVLKEGHLFSWLATLPEGSRPKYIGDITPDHLVTWRAAWKFKSDLTAKQRWSMVRVFFNFCASQNWIADSPARKIKPLKAAEGNRTAIFTDDQYADILDAVYAYEPENVPTLTKKNWQQRLTTFVELLRWSGMDLIDAIQYRPSIVDRDGVLVYRRQKTGKHGTVPLPENVLALLRSVPLERDSIGTELPFRSKGNDIASDTRKWQHRLGNLFKLAGITEVRTEIRTRRPHPKMFRDTFAVGYLKNETPLYSVAKMLGHSKVETTVRAYLPWVEELKSAHIAAVRNAMEKMKPVVPRGVTTLRQKAANR